METKTAAVSMRNVTKTFGSVVANDKISLDIYKGEILALLGENGPKLIRKAAHFAEFACLGFLLAGFFRARGRAPLLPGALCGLLSACVDETIQLFSPGRASAVADVWLDFAGTLAGIFLLHFGHILWTKTRKMNNSEEN